MRTLATTLLALALLAPTTLLAEVVVLEDGRVFEVDGPIRVQGDLIQFKLTTGQSVTLRRFQVDENKTRSLNQVLDSEVMGLPRLKRIEAIEAQRSRTRGRSIPIPKARPEPEAEEIRRMARERVPVRYPAGDYPVAVQPDRQSVRPVGRDQAERMVERGERPSPRRISPLRDDRTRMDEARSRRNAEAEQRRIERERRRAERQAERERRRAERQQALEERRAERERRRQERQAAREAARRERAADEAAEARERPEAPSPRPDARRDEPNPRIERYERRISDTNEEIAEARRDLRRLTDLQRDAQEEFEGARLRSVDREIDRLMRRIERLEKRKERYEERLQDVRSEE